MDKMAESSKPQTTEASLNSVKGISARHVMTFLGFVGIFNVYAMRVNLSVALVAMVNSTTATSPYDDAYWSQECPQLLNIPQNGTDTTQQGGEFNWDVETQARILGSFFYGYVVTQLPGGVFAESCGAKWLFGIGVFVTSVFTVLTPVAVVWGGASAFIAVRVVEGLGEGVTFPAMHSLLAKWNPVMERTRSATYVYTGSQAGTVFATFAAGFLSSSSFLGGWPLVFYVFGGLGCIWFIAWAFLVFESPREHPRISKAELLFIEQNQEKKPEKRAPIPWKAILTSKAVWFLALTHFGHNWGFYTMLTELPTYLNNILHFDIQKNGVLSSVPYITQAIFAWIASYVADRMRASGRMNITTIRKILNSVGFFGPAVCIACVAVAGCRPVLIIVLLSIGMGLNGFIYSGFNITHVDMSPEYAGTLMGITNCFANLSGFLAPAVVGKIVRNGQTQANWGLVFLITSLIYVFAGLAYDLFCTAELQPWGAQFVTQPPPPPPPTTPPLEEKPSQVLEKKKLQRT